MFCNGLLKIASSLNQHTLDHVLRASASKTWNKLFVFSEQKLAPQIISSIYNSSNNSPEVYVLCAGVTLDKYNLPDDIDVYISLNLEDQQGLKDLQSQNLYWKKTKFVHLPFELVNEDISEVITFDNGVLGGTFDDLHIGHKVLLTIAGTICDQRLLVGIAHDDLLKNKTLVEVLAPYSIREAQVRDFLQLVSPQLNIETVSISDAIGPAGTDPHLDVLVVSKETEGGVKLVNEARLHNNLNSLDSCVVDLVLNSGSEAKISSTNTRKDILGKLRPQLSAPWLRRLISTNLPHHKLPYVIGITGGICSGKSTLTAYLAEKDVTVIDCDKLGHVAYLPGQPAYKALVEEFGQGIVAKDGTIDRPALGGMVFGKPDNMRKLTDIVWPCIADLAKAQIAQCTTDIVVVEAAVLFEADWAHWMDEVWVMVVPPKEAVSRLCVRNGLTEEQAQARLASQLNNTERCYEADVVFCSQWAVEYTRAQAEVAWSELLDRVTYFTTCASGRDSLEVWEQVAGLVCEETSDPAWLATICRSERSESFLEHALMYIDQTRHLSKEKWVLLTTGFFFLATTLHVKNNSPRAVEAMFHMFKENNHVKKEIADEILVNLKLGMSLEKKRMPCTEFNLLFRDIWVCCNIQAEDEGSSIILPSIFTAEHEVQGQKLLQTESLARLAENNRFVFRTQWFREHHETECKAKVVQELQMLRDEGPEGPCDGTRGGYNLQEY